MTIYWLIILLLTIAYLFIFFFYLYGWLSAPETFTAARVPQIRVSIIVPVRNEVHVIADLINDLLHQDYPRSLFEIIVVDDFSTDRTVEVVNSVSSGNLKLIQLSEIFTHENEVSSSKKRAIEAGISHAFGDVIVTVDGDGRMNPEWLQAMMELFEKASCHMVVAPVKIYSSQSFFQRFQAMDIAGMAGITGATLNLHFPVMCNGANLAYRKKSFAELEGFKGISEISSGDDVLLMHKFAARWKNGVCYLKNKKAIVITEASRSVYQFIQQRMRWTSKSSAYRDYRIILNLVAVYLFNLSLIGSLIIASFNKIYIVYFISQLLLKLIVDFAFLSTVTEFFNQRRLLMFFLPIECMHVLYIVVIGFAGNIFKAEWKGRMVRK